MKFMFGSIRFVILWSVITFLFTQNGGHWYLLWEPWELFTTIFIYSSLIAFAPGGFLNKFEKGEGLNLHTVGKIGLLASIAAIFLLDGIIVLQNIENVPKAAIILGYSFGAIMNSILIYLAYFAPYKRAS